MSGSFMGVSEVMCITFSLLYDQINEYQMWSNFEAVMSTPVFTEWWPYIENFYLLKTALKRTLYTNVSFK